MQEQESKEQQYVDIINDLEKRLREQTEATGEAEANELALARTLIPYLIMERDSLRAVIQSSQNEG